MEITLQNMALMTTRIRALYTDLKCDPHLVESDTLWAFQTKSIYLPIVAGHIYVMVEKDLFFGNWYTVYNGTMLYPDQCIRITGTIFSSVIHKCG